MFVDHAARRRFEGRGQRCRRFGHVVVHERLQFRRFVSREERVDEEEELRLALVEVAHELHEEAQVALLLPHLDCRGVLACAREPRAVGGALYLDESLRAAAHRTDLLADGRTAASRPSDAAQRANHTGIMF